MKISKALFLTLMVAALIGGLAATGQAAPPWYVCQVEATGPFGAGTATRIFLTDTAASPAFQNQQFTVPPSRAKEFLAVALEAISLNKKVKVFTGPGTVAMPSISAIYLQAQ